MVTTMDVGSVGSILAVDDALKTLPPGTCPVSMLDLLTNEGRVSAELEGAVCMEHLEGMFPHPDIDPLLRIIVNPTRVVLRRE